MQAIEFIAKMKNGSIEVPKEFRTDLGSEFRVIILVESNSTIQPKKRTITSLEIDTKNFNFDRDEANER